MLNQILSRFSTLALLVAVGLVFSACDSDTADDPIQSENDAIQIESITPAPGNTVTPGDDTTWTIEFDESVADNFYTQAGTQETNASNVREDGTRLLDAISITPSDKELTPSGGIPKAISWNDSRDELTIDPLLGLEDGTVYNVNLSGLFDSGFVDEDGNQLLEGETLAASRTITVHALENSSAPAAPTVAFDDSEMDVGGDGELLDENYDYDSDPAVALDITGVDPDGDFDY